MRLLATATIFATLAAASSASAQSPRQPNWAEIERETLEHFQAILRLDTRNPPGRERRAAEYLKSVFDREGIPAELLALDSSRANVVARLKGNGRKRPLRIMAHTDVVTAGPMTMLLLKRLNVPLDRDVIFLAESGEDHARGNRLRHGAAVRQDRRRVRLAEGGGTMRV